MFGRVLNTLWTLKNTELAKRRVRTGEDANNVKEGTRVWAVERRDNGGKGAVVDKLNKK